MNGGGQNPDYLFATDTILTNKKGFQEFKTLYKTARINIMFAGEALFPDFNLFDYAVGFNDTLLLDDRYTSLPSIFVYPASFIEPKENNIIDIEQARQELKKKTAFCNFLYSNGHSHPMRDNLFYALNEYKRVDSLGRHLNSVGRKSEGYYENRQSSIDLKKPYRFSIASENAYFPGYTSEKLLTSFAAHTIPIYWGNPEVADSFNPKSFVNVHNYRTMDKLITRIKEIEENDNLWLEMVSAPWQTEKQKAKLEQKTKAYNTFFRNIFNQDLEDARRRPEGTWVDNYRKFLFEGHPSEFSRYKQRLLVKLNSLKHKLV